jgi:hypothetical protein
MFRQLNVETLIILAFLLVVTLWGVSKCRNKTQSVATSAATEAYTTDSLGSPAARASRVPQTIATQPLPSVQPEYPAGTGIQTGTTPPPFTTPPVPVNTPPPSSPGDLMPAQAPQVPSSYNTPAVKAPSVSSKATTEAPENAGMLYVLVNGVNVRVKPDLKAKSLGKLKLNDKVYFLDEVSDTPQTVRLADGTPVTKPWFKIKTKRGTIGWVHGSSVDFYKRRPQDNL